MTPNEKITELCDRHHVSKAFGRRLLPLIRRALDSAEEKRDRLLALVDRSFAEEAKRNRITPPKALTAKERRILRTVGGILHTWDPPEWMSHWNWGVPRPPSS